MIKQRRASRSQVFKGEAYDGASAGSILHEIKADNFKTGEHEEEKVCKIIINF